MTHLLQRALTYEAIPREVVNIDVPRGGSRSIAHEEGDIYSPYSVAPTIN